jgi:hypothetical protein
MSKRNFIGVTVVIFLLFVDLVIYQYHNADPSKRSIIPCYPPEKQIFKKDMSEIIKYNSAFRPGPEIIK